MMLCPSCRRGLPVGPHERCPFCAAVLAAPVEGALAPELGGRGKVEPVREIPGLRKRERTWKDEVRDRVRERRTQRGGSLPLFPDTHEDENAAPAGQEPITPAAAVVEPVALEDMPLRPAVPDPPATELRLRPSGREGREPAALDARQPEWQIGSGPETRPVATPVERPASAGERARAALIDLGLLVPLWALAAYGAARAAQVEIAALWPAWPWLLAYCAGFGLLYAGGFTSVAGRTPGKMVVGLRVLGPGDRAPGWTRATFRTFLGACGVLAAGVGLFTMLVDPARRALHDRLLRTRVVKG